MNLSPAQQRFPRLTRFLPSAAHFLWYVVALMVGRALHNGLFDCRHAILPCAVSTAFSMVLTVAGALGILCLAGHGIVTGWANTTSTGTAVTSFLKEAFSIARVLLNPVIYAAAVALGIAMFAVQQKWLAFAFIFGGGLGMFMQMPAFIALIRALDD